MLKFNLDKLDGLDLVPDGISPKEGRDALAYSAAVSAKRQADALETIAKHLAPVNVDAGIDRAADMVLAAADGLGPVAISKYVMSRVEMLALDFNWWSEKAKHELIQIAIAAVREWDKMQAELDGFRPTGAATVRKDGDLFWLRPDDHAILSMRNDVLIEVRYVTGQMFSSKQLDQLNPTKLYLGEAIEWSTWNTGPRRLKASIAEWRPL